MLAVLLAIGGVAVARARHHEASRPGQGWTEYPSESPVPVDPEPVFEPMPDPFAEFTTIGTPRPNAVNPVVLLHGEPAFLFTTGREPVAYVAFGGPEHARVLMGWCAASKTFQDATGTYVYDAGGLPYGDGAFPMPHHDARRHGADVEISAEQTARTGSVHGPRKTPAKCAAALLYPRLPERVDDVHRTVEGFRVVNGRYVVSTESASFCAPVSGTGCAAQGWEAYRLGTLPGSDLAGSYTWEGDFVVRGDPEGHLTAVRMPGARLVSRTDVGVRWVFGEAESVDTAGENVTVRVIVLGRGDAKGTSDDTGYQDVVVRPDADVFVGRGRTGLGQPKGNAETLRAYIASGEGQKPMWFVLGGDGLAIRVVVM